MTDGDSLPTTPGSLADTPDRHRWTLCSPFHGVLRWRRITGWQRLSLAPDPDQFAAMNPTVIYVAPPWAGDPGSPEVQH